PNSERDPELVSDSGIGDPASEPTMDRPGARAPPGRYGVNLVPLVAKVSLEVREEPLHPAAHSRPRGGVSE
ncbi:MAG: hypothetical protein ACYCUF_00820, partial [Acidimicrobiales bacterium]